MKTLICSLAILCSVVLSTIFVAIYTNKVLSNFEDVIDENLSHDYSEAVIGVEKIKKEYGELKPFLILFMREDDLREIEMHIEDARSAARENENAALTEAKSRLKLHIEQLRRLSVFSIEAIF